MDCLDNCVDREIYNEGGDGWVVRWEEKSVELNLFFNRLEQCFSTCVPRRTSVS